MTATIVSSVAHRRRLERASAWLQGRGQSEELLVVGATLDGANELARTIARGKGVTFGWHRLGISQLAFAIASPALAERGLAPLSRVGTEAIVARIVHQMRAGGRLTQYVTAATAPGFPRAVTRVVSELRAARVRLDAVKDVAADLAVLLEAYERELAASNLSDWSAVLQLATDAVKRPDRHQLIGLPTILLDVPVASEAECAFAAALAGAAPEVLATAAAAEITTIARFRDRLGFTFEDLDAGGGDRRELPGTLGQLQRHLFNERDRRRLRYLAEELDGGDPKRRRQPAKDRPIAGTRLIREYQGIEHCVTVCDDGYEYQGRPYKSLSAIARAITGTRWNGLTFFGLKNQRDAR